MEHLYSRRRGRPPAIEIVGVVEDARGFSNIRGTPLPGVFVPLSQRPVTPRTLEARTAVDPARTTATVRSIDPALRASRVDPLGALRQE